MDALAYDLKRLCDHSRQGSIATQANRRRMLAQMAEDLKGFKLPAARSIKPKHIEFLVAKWQAEGITPATQKNRMATIRWWCGAVNKASIANRDNEEYGIAPREKARPRGKVLERERLMRIACPFSRASLVLMEQFGLRREEALKFRVAWADKGDHLELKPSWTKGGRGRVIPITTSQQRAVLDRLHQVTGSGSLIPEGRNYKQHMKAFENACRGVGIMNVHGIRHGWAQRRYQDLTGWAAPAAGGPTRDEMSARQKNADYEARMRLTHELGHGRVAVTSVYLGE